MKVYVHKVISSIKIYFAVLNAIKKLFKIRFLFRHLQDMSLAIHPLIVALNQLIFINILGHFLVCSSTKLQTFLYRK